MQIVQVSLQPFRYNSPLKCAPQPKIAKAQIKPISCEFKVVDVVLDTGTPKKLLTNLQPFSH